jgi:transketolase
MNETSKDLELMCINTIRTLAADAVQQAKSGHPGMPLGAASMAHVLWAKFLRHNPRNPIWFNRDRFILSAGHGSALLYALLHMHGYNISLDDLRNFRQWGAATPGHPEYDIERGIECTTGPLGQGFAMGVGMAVAERFLAAKFNRPDFPIVDHFTYAIVSDGDLMEGISSEAASLAGHLKLGKLIYLYDDNQISIEGSTDITFTEDVAAVMDARGWHVQKVLDGNDTAWIESAIENARHETEKPSIIMVRTHIGYGSPKQDSASAHGEPLGEEALKATKEKLGWPLEPRFFVPEEVSKFLEETINHGEKLEEQWIETCNRYKWKYPDQAARFQEASKDVLPEGWDAYIPKFQPQDGPMATRVASGKVLNSIAKALDNVIGGSADLAPSTKTLIGDSPDQSLEHPEGRNLRFGVREHAMGAIVNGMALHGGVVPYGATFFIFSDYMRPSLRLAALMNVHSIFVFTHDSLAVGEDGPTHQPVEQLASLRAMPNMTVIRPADANETAAAWIIAVTRNRPVCMALSRQNLPVLDPGQFSNTLENVSRGAYVISEAQGKPDIILMASGAEVSLALEAQGKLAGDHNVMARVVSMPSWELFQEQPEEYRKQVLPSEVRQRLSIEAGSSLGWSKWVGENGSSISVDRFGSSAPGSVVLRNYGFNVDNVVACALSVLGR